MKRNYGFTLIEVLVVATIIGILTSVAVVSYQKANKNAHDARRKTDLEQIRAALEMYRSDNADSEYPGTLNVCAGVDSLSLSDYLDPVPTDPRDDSQYQYKKTDNGYCVSATMEGNPTGSLCNNSCGTTDFGLKAP